MPKSVNLRGKSVKLEAESVKRLEKSVKRRGGCVRLRGLLTRGLVRAGSPVRGDVSVAWARARKGEAGRCMATP